MEESVCTPDNCKVKRSDCYQKIEEMRQEGYSLRDIEKYTAEHCKEKISIGTLSHHFKEHYLTDLEEETILDPLAMARALQGDIKKIDDLIEQERAKDKPSGTVISNLIKEKRHLTEYLIKNQHKYLDKGTDTPEHLIETLRNILKEKAISEEVQIRLLKSLEKDLGLRE